MMLADDQYEMLEGELPPHKLEFDCCGSITIKGSKVITESGEIKSSSGGKLTAFSCSHHEFPPIALSEFSTSENQLYRRFKLLACVLPKIFADTSTVTASGWTYALMSRRDIRNKRSVKETL
jgi:hypothetical protein